MKFPFHQSIKITLYQHGLPAKSQNQRVHQKAVVTARAMATATGTGAIKIGLFGVIVLALNFGLKKAEAKGFLIRREPEKLVDAKVAFQHALIGEGQFSILVLMGGVTTFITPMLFRRFTIPE